MSPAHYYKIPKLKRSKNCVRTHKNIIKCKNCNKILVNANANRRYCDDCR